MESGRSRRRLINRHTARDIDAFTPERRGSANALVDMGAREGIHVTPAEATGLTSLKSQQSYLGNTWPGGGPVPRTRGDEPREIAEAFVDRAIDSTSTAPPRSTSSAVPGPLPCLEISNP